MIAFLEGIVEVKGEKSAVLNVGGVGYRIIAGAETLRHLPAKGNTVKIWTHQHVREDALELYGFLHPAEVELFEMIINIPGIGPRSATGVLNVAPLETLKKAIAAGDTSYLTRVSGIGRKIAEKVVLELKEKMAGGATTLDAPELGEEADALDALVALGYTANEARSALAAVSPDVTGARDRVREALKRIGRG